MAATFTLTRQRCVGFITDGSTRDGSSYRCFALKDDREDIPFNCVIFDDAKNDVYKISKAILHPGGVYNVTGELSQKIKEYIDRNGEKQSYSHTLFKILSIEGSLPKKEYEAVKAAHQQQEPEIQKVSGFGRE